MYTLFVVTSNIIDADTVEEAVKECDTGDEEGYVRILLGYM